ncbi:MAG: galactose mutarotase [Rhizobiales bacterium 65-9]|nr:galactose mutarotase [Hyphomicrobiales bacterium]OJY33135.1 MAG: galactose mutarotase [Rhizobiales bacterium 65-9]
MAAPRIFGTLADGREIREVTLRSKAGAEATVMEWGAVVRDMRVPLASGGSQRVVLGLNDIEDYVLHSPHMGAIAGRFANRIRGGSFILDGERFQLPLNFLGRHSAHGGGYGFGRRPWTILDAAENYVVLALHVPAGDQGYPGAMTVACRYTLREPATLRVGLTATCNAPTIINLCHHSYFNLDGSPDILDHVLQVNADVYTPTDDELIPTGEMLSVSGAPLDFREPRKIRTLNERGERVRFDNNFILRRDRVEDIPPSGLHVAHAATVWSEKSRLRMEVWTTEPGLQFYDAAKMNLPVAGLDGVQYGPCAGLCLEPQHAPDSPNLPQFPSTVLRPGEAYRQVTEYRIS